jgi:hypothetical protein
MWLFKFLIKYHYVVILCSKPIRHLLINVLQLYIPCGQNHEIWGKTQFTEVAYCIFSLSWLLFPWVFSNLLWEDDLMKCLRLCPHDVRWHETSTVFQLALTTMQCQLSELQHTFLHSCILWRDQPTTEQWKKNNF